MRGCVNWKSSWPAFGLIVLVGVLVMSLFALLGFLEFDLETSLAWQVGVYYLMLFSFLSLIFVVAFQRPLGLISERGRWAVLALAFLTPVAVFAGGWALGGSYSGFRDPRLFQVTVISVSSFALLWMTVFIPCSWFLLVRVVFRHFRRPRALDSS